VRWGKLVRATEILLVSLLFSVTLIVIRASDPSTRSTDNVAPKMNLRTLQIEQHNHDLRNHLDILALHKIDRIKHYGLHYAKYVGRFARGDDESKSVKQTLVDAFLVALSSANALNQKLDQGEVTVSQVQPDYRKFADATGRFADACEKIDHLEGFRDIALAANKDIVAWILAKASAEHIDLVKSVEARREELSKRQAYH
jgi:hypothetical protein